jgi:hypothetical protein
VIDQLSEREEAWVARLTSWGVTAGITDEADYAEGARSLVTEMLRTARAEIAALELRLAESEALVARLAPQGGDFATTLDKYEAAILAMGCALATRTVNPRDDALLDAGKVAVLRVHGERIAALEFDRDAAIRALSDNIRSWQEATGVQVPPQAEERIGQLVAALDEAGEALDVNAGRDDSLIVRLATHRGRASTAPPSTRARPDRPRRRSSDPRSSRK